MRIIEKLFDDYQQEFDGEMIYDSILDDIEIFDTKRFGKVLMLDGVVQLTEKDNHIYHEAMLVPLTLLAPSPFSIMSCYKKPKIKILVVGGGDGGTLKALQNITNINLDIVLVEISQQVIDLTTNYIPSVNDNGKVFDKVSVIIQDASKYVKTCNQSFDVILVDSTDPIGSGEVLFGQEFYSDCSKILTTRGVICCQSGVFNLQPEEVEQTYKRLVKIFDHVVPFCFSVPTYVGGEMFFMLASNTNLTSNMKGASIYKLGFEEKLKFLCPITLQYGFDMGEKILTSETWF